jgi:4-amino-4-deoxy-L-arabinose transferase-like glycosyltransferase
MDLINLKIPRKIIVFICFTFLSFLLRFWSFFDSVIDHDESLYFLIAQSFLNGIPPYVEIWDNKPPGIFILFSLAILIFGDSITSIRILACLSVAVTSYFLYEIAKLIGNNNEKIGLIAGILYLVFSLSNNGVAANAEILFAPLVTLAFYLLFKNTKYGYYKYFVIGLLLGLAMQIKYVVIMDFIAFLVIVITRLFFKQNKNNNSIIALIKIYMFATLGFIVPFLFTAIYFITVGYFDEYFYATFISNTKYVDATKFSLINFLFAIVNQIYTNFPLYLCLFISFIYIKSSKIISLKDKMNLCSLIYWFSSTFVATLISTRFIGHYYLQLLPPLCLISSYIIVQTVTKQAIKNKRNLFLIIMSVLIFLITLYPHLQKNTELVVNQYIKQQKYLDDKEVLIANYINSKISPNNYIYIANYQPIIYYLVRAKLPTKYVFTSHLISYYSVITGINPLQELTSIMDKKPVYVLFDEKRGIDNNEYKIALNEYLKKDYLLEKTIRNVKLYRIKNPN